MDLSESNATSYHEPPAKKPKTESSTLPEPTTEGRLEVVRKFRGHRGKLEKLLELPLDVLDEVLGHIGPLDLLRLSRTSKALRGFLMEKSCRHIWKAARRNLGMPDCPEDMSEPQYANLAFDLHCHVCPSRTAHQPIWAARIRCCKPCQQKLFLPMQRELPSAPIFPTIIHQEVPWVWRSGRRRGRKYHYQPLVDKYSEEFLKVAHDPGLVSNWQAIVLEQLARGRIFAEALENWSSLQYAEHATESRSALKDRETAILEKLYELGWSPEIHGSRGVYLRTLSVFRVRKRLTDRSWKRIRRPLEDLLQEIRSFPTQLEIARQDLIDSGHQTLLREHAKHIDALPMTDTFPPVADFVEYQPIKHTISRIADELVETANRTFDSDLLRSTTGKNIAMSVSLRMKSEMGSNIAIAMDNHFLQFCGEWRWNKALELTAIMNSLPNNREVFSFGLQLATTFFFCRFSGPSNSKRCEEPIAYPDILLHPCMSAPSSVPKTDDHLERACSNLRGEPWNFCGGRVVFDEMAHLEAVEVVRACGLWPDAATPKDMDAEDAFLECLPCQSESGRLVMRWKRAVSHAVMFHTTSSQSRWVRLRGTDCEDARTAEETLKNDACYDAEPNLELFYCGICKHRGTSSEVQAHLEVEHGLRPARARGKIEVHPHSGYTPPPFILTGRWLTGVDWLFALVGEPIETP